MTHHSSAELDPSQATSVDVPLSERPLVADDQNTVISADAGPASVTELEVHLNASAQEIRDRLFAAPDAEEHPECGLRLGHFEIEERIGSGGMGAVFRAVDLDLSRYVALKVLHPSIAADPALVARFRNEARACAALNHDNVARVFFTGEQDGVHYIAYEFADGVTIKEMITEQGRLTTEESVNYAIQCTLALSHVEAAGIVHRDIKPSNIIVTHRGRIKVVDLGLARRETTDSVGDLTVAGTTLGTFDYISPEQARDPRTADIRSDIYSLGCTVYHMLTGQPPYPEGTALQKLLDHQGKSPPDPRTVVPDIPPELSVIVRKMMNTDPTQRYQDPGQLLADLLSLAAHLGLRSVPAEGIIWRRISVTRVRELSGSLFLTGAVLAICITALIIHFTPERNRFTEANGLAANRPSTSLQPKSDTSSTSSDTENNNGETPATGGSQSASDSGENSTNSSEATTPPNDNVPMQVLADDEPFVLRDVSGSETRYESLTLAWDKAKHGDEIILDFDGPLSATRKSLVRPKTRRSLTLRAAPGRHPLILIRPDLDESHLFYLNNDQLLTVHGVDFRVVLADSSSDTWSLFQCNGPNQVSMRDCTVEIDGAESVRREASVFLVQDAATSPSDESLTRFQLTNSAVRGHCDLITIAGQITGSLELEQCGFMLDGSLIVNLGRSRQATGMTPPDPGTIDLQMQYCTCLLTETLIRMQDSEVALGGEQERDLPEINLSLIHI